MRRIYKTTTALVACLSIIAPQLAVAQVQQAPNGDEQLILPKKKPAEAEQKPKAQAQEKAERQNEPQKKPQPRQEPEPKQQQAQEKPKPAEQVQKPRQQAEPKAEKPKAEPAREAAPEPQLKPREALQQPEAPAEKPPVTQAQEPKAKPPVVEAETPRAKPADAKQSADRIQKMRDEARKQPEAKPDSPKAVTTADPAPAQKPAEQAQKPADDPDAAALKQALEARSNDKPAAKPGQPQPGEAARDPAPEPKLRQPGEQRRQDDPQQAGQGTPQAPSAEEIARRLQQDRQADGQQQARPGQPQPGEIQAPEAQVTPNDVAKRAAETLPPVAAAALAAATQQQDESKLDEVQITKDNARRSDQDFETSIIQGLNGDQPRDEQRRKEARRDDDDDNLKDIGKLLLAGAAGFAVGKMLSNDRQVALNTGDRVVVTLPDGSQQVIKDDNALLYQPGSNVRTETFDDGSTRTTVLREDGSRVVTIRDANMNILRRTLVRADGSETRLIDDTEAEPVRISTLPAPPPVELSRRPLDEAALREALRREASVDRRFTLGQIRDIPEVRALVAPVNVPEITFDTGSSAITPDQAQQLATLGKVIRDSVAQNPAEVYMIEGYTDAVGSNAANLALSDRRAESVALALTEYFQVPPENMVVQGYGEQFLLVPSDGPERDNRRVAVRRITDLMERN